MRVPGWQLRHGGWIDVRLTVGSERCFRLGDASGGDGDRLGGECCFRLGDAIRLPVPLHRYDDGLLPIPLVQRGSWADQLCQR